MLLTLAMASFNLAEFSELLFIELIKQEDIFTSFRSKLMY